MSHERGTPAPLKRLHGTGLNRNWILLLNSDSAFVTLPPDIRAAQPFELVGESLGGRVFNPDTPLPTHAPKMGWGSGFMEEGFEIYCQAVERGDEGLNCEFT